MSKIVGKVYDGLRSLANRITKNGCKKKELLGLTLSSSPYLAIYGYALLYDPQNFLRYFIGSIIATFTLPYFAIPGGLVFYYLLTYFDDRNCRPPLPPEKERKILSELAQAQRRGYVREWYLRKLLKDESEDVKV